MTITNKITEKGYDDWIEDFVRKVIKNANINPRTIEIEGIGGPDEKVFIKVDGVDYVIRTWNFHPMGCDSHGIPCSELVEYSLFLGSLELDKGAIYTQWKNCEISKCCGTCKYHKYDYKIQGWICNNPGSEHEADWMDYSDSCAEYEENGE